MINEKRTRSTAPEVRRDRGAMDLAESVALTGTGLSPFVFANMK
jgi:hypothetical protein